MNSTLNAALVNVTSEIGHHGCTLVCRQIEALTEQSGIRIGKRFSLSQSLTANALSGFDLIIVNGEGSLHHDRPAAARIAEVAAEARAAGQKAYLVNSVYEANGKAIARKVEQFRRIYVRESESQAELAASGIESHVVPDLTLTWKAPHRREGRKIRVTDSVDRRDTELLFGLSKRLGAEFSSLMTRPPRIADFPDQNFPRILKHRWRRATAHFRRSVCVRAKLLHQHDSFEDFIAWLNDGVGLVVTGRFHALCLAIDLEIPVLALPSNTKKVQGMLADAGLLSRYVADRSTLEKLTEEDISRFTYSDRELETIRSFRSSALSRAEAMFNDIAEDARRP